MLSNQGELNHGWAKKKENFEGYSTFTSLQNQRTINRLYNDADEAHTCNGSWELFTLAKPLAVDWLVSRAGVHLLEYSNFCTSFSGFFKKT